MELQYLSFRERIFSSRINVQRYSVYSDASFPGYAGYVVNAIHGVSHGMWSVDEQFKSSTMRELMAVFRVLMSLGVFAI